MSGIIQALLHTNYGPIRLELFPERAPATVRNFVQLAEGTRRYIDPLTGETGEGPYYDGTISHRVIADFMIQMGDRLGTGMGRPGYSIDDEVHPDLFFDRPYVLAMANAGPNINGSQFFITLAPRPDLDGHYSIFGKVADEDSARVVDSIANVPTTATDRPIQDVIISRVEIIRSLVGAAQ